MVGIESGAIANPRAALPLRRGDMPIRNACHGAEGLTKIKSNFGPNDTMDRLEAEVKGERHDRLCNVRRILDREIWISGVNLLGRVVVTR